MGTIEKAILAVVTRDMERAAGGPDFLRQDGKGNGTPGLYAGENPRRMAHRLDPLTMIIVRHA